MWRNLAVVSLTNIRKNVLSARNKLSGKSGLYAVVKANAYGHGLIPVAQAIEEIVDGFVVTDLAEGIALRIVGVQKEILLLTPPLSLAECSSCILHDLTLTVCNFSSYDLTKKASDRLQKKARAHLKINTGMNRLGLCGAPLARLCDLIKKEDAMQIEGVYSHLYLPSDKEASEKQYSLFVREKERAEKYFPLVRAHLSATGGILLGERYHFDLVRAGICLYGYTPNGFSNDGFLPAMKVYARAMQTHTFTGGGVGYAKATENYLQLTAYSLGYADGFWKAGKNFSPFDLCMDMSIRQGKDGYGRKKLVMSDAETVAKQWGTIPYEVLCSVTRRAYFEYR